MIITVLRWAVGITLGLLALYLFHIWSRGRGDDAAAEADRVASEAADAYLAQINQLEKDLAWSKLTASAARDDASGNAAQLRSATALNENLFEENFKLKAKLGRVPSTLYDTNATGVHPGLADEVAKEHPINPPPDTDWGDPHTGAFEKAWLADLQAQTVVPEDPPPPPPEGNLQPGDNELTVPVPPQEELVLGKRGEPTTHSPGAARRRKR